MRPQFELPRRLATVAPRRFQTTKPVRRKRELPVEEASFDRNPDASKASIQRQPYKVSALGAEIPDDIPQVPLHIDQIESRRLRWYMRTMNEDKMTPEDEDRLARAMERTVKPSRPQIAFKAEDAGASVERKDFFAIPGEDGYNSGAISAGEITPGLEPGRVVEIRREAGNYVGVILAPITVALKERLLLLQSTGEIWPVGVNDIQFVMPKSLIPEEVSSKAWHPDLLQMWKSGDDIGSGEFDESSIIGAEEAGEMLAARRKIATVLRRVLRETERMQGRLLSGSVDSGRGGGMDALWEGLVPADPNTRGSISAAAAAEFLLNRSEAQAEDGENRITVRPGTLPAYAAHRMLMDRPDLFLGADISMWEEQTFLVRSRADVELHNRVERWVTTQDPIFLNFVDKAQKVRAAIKAGGELPEWTEDERDILYTLTMALFERRGTQQPHNVTLACSIAKWFSSDVNDIMSLGFMGPLLNELGVLPTYDSAMPNKLIESASRSASMAGFVMPTEFGETAKEPVAADAALDALRQEFSHRVYVIDDPTALELDDGIALEPAGGDQYWVHMYVADPTRFIEREGMLSKAASVLGTAHYLHEGTVPLLPPSLAGGKLSLGAADGQPTMVFSAKVDTQGTVHDWKVGMGFTKNTVVTTYDAVNDALGIEPVKKTYPFGKLRDDLIVRPPLRALDTLEAGHNTELQTLMQLSLALRAVRYKDAGFEWVGSTPSVGVYNIGPVPTNLHDREKFPAAPRASPALDKVQLSYEVVQRPLATSATTMVTEFMVLANQIAAWFCDEHNLAAAFRGSGLVTNTNATPPELTVEKLLAQRTPGTGYVGMDQAKIGSLLFPTTQLSPTPIPHWLMGLSASKGYMWATSPLRRYDDMLAHWQIKGALAAAAGVSGGEGVLFKEAIWPLIKRTSYGQQRGRTAQRTDNRYFTSLLFEQRASGPLPEGYEVDPAEAVDLHAPMDATVTSRPYYATYQDNGPYFVDISVPTLGLVSSVGFGTQAEAQRRAPIGATIKVVFHQTAIWPLPRISMKNAA
ncbi:uncharacterized protein CcaverHIS019_0308220 [Cutaneotrichosporon cavernicola]|uniref:RNB domain-containing protein n=1 Tax=Cutaneotrichosporon cavernicola TaxID=279322 RepID=A0AA48ID60_9TREE|nr:uncharacterized protein CcaverHIS019_0308220 [Cutaneotrichosporon cavernicola]BEI90752.1 hypothetical protein CcaverHIS019_0308220 [Cutaneotrichosporon cavernicola]BEI98532.1 hypothetical protein CcaverHIS631_0308310 [Cutaneotrichosporon cavernicola]BEJ06303.1 hypothetical protein CcaverHIS641_0308250 [Cutaneotrichosporon cavernicola]